MVLFSTIESLHSFRRNIFQVLLWTLCVGALMTFPAVAQTCSPSTAPGTLIGFTPLPGDLVMANSCNLLPCHEPEKVDGPSIVVSEGCDALSGPCPVRGQVTLDFPGNSQLPTNGHVRVYWFDQGTPDPEACLPPPFGSCSPISICGPLGAEILVDKGETWVQLGVSCNDIASGAYQERSFSLSAYACQTVSGECTERLDVPDIDMPPPEALWEMLKCDPPPPPCEECPCNIGGGPGGPFGGGPPGFGPPGSGPGAQLRYKGRGAGHPEHPGSLAWNSTLGRYWSHDYAQRVVLDPDDLSEQHVWLITADGSFLEFENLVAGEYQDVTPSDEYRRLTRSNGGWALHELDGTVHSFDSNGLWQRSEDLDGNAKVASYVNGILTTVSFPDGRSETFSYHGDGKLASIMEVGVGGAAQRVWNYTWAGPDLIRIDRPDGTAWAFRYDNPSLPGYITRMTLVGRDGGERVEGAWAYDFRGNVLRTWTGDESFSGPDAAFAYRFSFDNPFRPTQTVVTNPLGQVTTYEVERDPGGVKARTKSVVGTCGACNLGTDTQFFYDDPRHPLRPTRTIDAVGTTTLMAYDANGQMTSRTEALGDQLERTTTWEYEPALPGLVTEIERPSTSGSGVRRTTWTYDPFGNATVRTEEGVESGAAFSYDEVTSYNGAGQPLFVDPPGFGALDRMTWTYDPARGDILPLSRTIPKIGTISFGYNPFNERTTVTDVNGVVESTEYDPMGRALSVTRQGASAAEHLVTTHVYNEFGDLFRTILPRGNLLEYSYDPAGRLLSFERRPSLTERGERHLYQRNGLGQPVRDQVQVWNGTAFQTESSTDFEYSSQCKVEKILYPGGAVVEFDYDCEGKLEREWDANHPSNNRQNLASVEYSYDALDRLTSTRRPWGGAGGGGAEVRYEYDVQDHLTRFTDANGTTAEFIYSDRDLITQEISEVGGTIVSLYNEHGQVRQRTDGRGVTVETDYDEIDRLVFEDYAEDSLDVTYVYDDPTVPFSKGQLTAISRNQQQLDFRYDRFGRLTQDGNLAYGYDKNGNVVSLSYPGDVTAVYTYDHADRQESLSFVRGTQTPRPLVVSSIYKPSGPLSRLVLGNGLSEERDFDTRYYPTSIRVPGHLDWAYTTDSMGLVTAITDGLEPEANRTYAYQDYQYVLSTSQGPWGSLTWTYDRAGNRLTETRDGVSVVTGYVPNGAGNGSSLLATLGSPGAPEPTKRYFQDASGNLTHENRAETKVRHRYDGENRLSQMRRDASETLPAIADFEYDGRGFLARSTATLVPGLSATWETRPTYSSRGVLLHRSTERSPLPSSPRETPRLLGEDYVFYFAGRPVAQLGDLQEIPLSGSATTREELLFLTTDHIGTPVLATNAAGSMVWKGGFEPFGGDFSGAGEAGIFLRFPGQWQDEVWEQVNPGSALHYNVYRWYQVETGRYSRPDPLGPLHAPNLFSYAAANPVIQTDRLGLQNRGIPTGAVPCTDADQTDILLPEPKNNCLPCDQGGVSGALDNASSQANKYCLDPYNDENPYTRDEMPLRRGGLAVDTSSGRISVTAWIRPEKNQPCVNYCRCAHEAVHVGLAQDQISGTADYTSYYHECEAYMAQIECLLNYQE